MSLERAERDRLVEDVYHRVPLLNCKRKCQQSCGLVPVAPIELERIVERHGELPTYETTGCPLLSAEGDCTIHDDRPLMCRAWGVAIGMECPWGCKPAIRLTRQQFFLLMKRLYGGELPDPSEDPTFLCGTESVREVVGRLQEKGLLPGQHDALLPRKPE